MIARAPVKPRSPDGYWEWNGRQWTPNPTSGRGMSIAGVLFVVVGLATMFAFGVGGGLVMALGHASFAGAMLYMLLTLVGLAFLVSGVWIWKSR